MTYIEGLGTLGHGEYVYSNKHIYDFKLKGESKDNEIFFLEVNGQVCFHPDGAFVIAGKTKNYSYSDIICHIIDFAHNNIRKQCVIGGIHG